MKVLMVMYDDWAVSYFRIGWPAKYINLSFEKEDITVTLLNSQFNVWDIAGLGEYDIIHFHKYFGKFEDSEVLWGELQKRGVKMVMDLDDHWDWPDDMPFTKVIKDEGLFKKEIGNLKLADYVTTTTSEFAEKIKKYNKNVKVLPNGINTSHNMWLDKPFESEAVRIAWLGSFQRNYDLELLRPSIQKLYADKELEGKFSMVLCGGDDNDIFDGPGFTKHLYRYPSEYGYMYNKVDVCLAPLVRNEFNSCRSELKYVEAGIKKKVFIGENYGPYAKGITHGINGLLVDTPDDWYKHIKEVILNQKLRKDLGENLFELVKDKFNIKNLIQSRVEFYKSICNADKPSI